MVFWYAVLQFKISDPGEILDWLQQMYIFIESSLGLSCGFFYVFFFLVQSAYLACFKS